MYHNAYLDEALRCERRRDLEQELRQRALVAAVRRGHPRRSVAAGLLQRFMPRLRHRRHLPPVARPS
jgi:DnaJ-domain-containing protein 1